MKRLILILDEFLRGRIAVGFAVVMGAWLAWTVFGPLPWRRFPDVLGMFRSSWLYLAIAGAIAYSGMAAVARQPGFPMGSLTCLVIGLIWKSTKVFWFMPFNFSRYLIIYGLAALLAHGIRRSLCKPELKVGMGVGAKEPNAERSGI